MLSVSSGLLYGIKWKNTVSFKTGLTKTCLNLHAGHRKCRILRFFLFLTLVRNLLFDLVLI
mgnify:CR=1 FL=1